MEAAIKGRKLVARTLAVRTFAALALGAALAFAPALGACPSCAEAAAQSPGGNPWTVVGFFLGVPFVLGAAVVTLVRREIRRPAETA